MIPSGWGTFSGLAVAALGTFGVADYFGGTEGMANFLNLLLQVAGLAYAAYRRYTATKIYQQ